MCNSVRQKLGHTNPHGLGYFWPFFIIQSVSVLAYSSSMTDHLMMMLSVRLSQSHKKGQNMYFLHVHINNYLYKNRLWCGLP